MGAVVYKSRFEHSAFVWNSIFDDRRVRFYSLEDKVAVEGETTDTSRPVTSQIVIERFLDYRCKGDRERYLYRDVQIQTFLRGLKLEHLHQGLTSDVNNPTALIDDRRNPARPSAAGSSENGPIILTLSAQNLYHLLRNSRYQPSPTTDISHAFRRTIYITDVNPYCVLALLATVSPIQVAFLRDFIWRNLTFHRFLGVRILPSGFKTFALEFHLPYYAWRPLEQDSTNGSQSIHRRRTHRIRQSQEVKYLNTPQGKRRNDTFREYVYEAQLSILVTGIDSRFWTAYCFADVYFKSPSYSETAEYFHQSNEDAHSGGKDSSMQTVWDAREYFLRILACRMEHVREEWSNVISHLLLNIEPFADKIFAESSDTSSCREHDITQEESYRWTIRVLRKYTCLLSKTISAWEAFEDGEIGYFLDKESKTYAHPPFGEHVAAVRREVNELIDLKRRLQHQTEVFEHLTNSMATHAGLAENRTLRHQSNFIQALTVITIFYLPLNLASSIYSMQSTLLPEFVQLNDYIYTLLGLTFATLILVINLPHIMKLWQALRKCQDLLWKLCPHVVKISVNWLFATKESSSRPLQQDLEMQSGNLGDHVTS